MRLRGLHIRNYRSARQVRLDLGDVNVLVGPNGCGKTNLYRALGLLFAAADGRLASSLAEEGGLPSALWAGSRRRGERARLSIAVETDMLGYELVCGVPPPQGSWSDRNGEVRGTAFALDPEVKEERIWLQDERGKEVVLAERKARSAWLRDEGGRRTDYPVRLDGWESLLGQVRDPERYPELARLREVLRSWRFYHLFRTDPGAPLRQPRVGVRTLALGAGGDDLAAALQTIQEIGDNEGLHAAVEAAFPGARLGIDVAPDARMSVQLQLPGIGRPFDARELSDGTLRYLCLLAALKSPRPPTLLALNEPETSLHPDMLEPLAQLLADASRSSQLWITTHSRSLADAVARLAKAAPIELEKVDGETRVMGDS